MFSREYLTQAHYSLLREVSSQPGKTLSTVESETGISFKKLKKVFAMVELFTNSELDKINEIYPFLMTEYYKQQTPGKRSGLLR